MRKLRKLVLPEWRAPMIKTLTSRSVYEEVEKMDENDQTTHLNGVGSFLLRTLLGPLTVLTMLLA